jgi:hypothetical protein
MQRRSQSSPVGASLSRGSSSDRYAAEAERGACAFAQMQACGRRQRARGFRGLLVLSIGPGQAARLCNRVQPAAPAGLPTPSSPLVHPPRSTRCSAAPPDQGGAGPPGCVCKSAAGDSNREPWYRRRAGLSPVLRSPAHRQQQQAGACRFIANDRVEAVGRGDVGLALAKIKSSGSDGHSAGRCYRVKVAAAESPSRLGQMGAERASYQ